MKKGIIRVDNLQRFLIQLRMWSLNKLYKGTNKIPKGGNLMKNKDKKDRNYSKPEVKKHDNLKDITLLSFTGPETTYDIDKK